MEPLQKILKEKGNLKYIYGRIGKEGLFLTLMFYSSARGPLTRT